MKQRKKDKFLFKYVKKIMLIMHILKENNNILLVNFYQACIDKKCLNLLTNIWN